MKKRLLAGLICIVLTLGNIGAITAFAEEKDTSVIDSEEIASEEIASEEIASEIIAPEEIELEEIAPTETGALEYFDISNQLFYNGAISPQYEGASEEEVYQDAELVGGSSYTARDFCIYLYEKLKSRPSSISISEYKDVISASSSEQAAKLLSGYMTATLNEHPEFFEITGGFSYMPVSSNGVYYISTIYPKYDTAAHDMNLLNERIQEALSYVTDDMSDVQKAIALHEYIIQVCEYDYSRYLKGTLSSHPDTYNMYGVLVDNMAVCQGYAETYKYLLNQVGITAHIVSSDNRNHAWNLVLLDGEYYQVDCTFDDPVYDKLGRIYHTNMFCSDNNSTFYSKHVNGTKDWVVYADYQIKTIVATDTRYESSYWNGVNTALVYHDGYYYYATSSSYYGYTSVCREVATSLTTIANNIILQVKDGTAKNTAAFEMNGKFCFNTGRYVYAMDYNTLAKQIIFDAGSSIMYRAINKHGEVFYSTDEPYNDFQSVEKGKFELASQYYVVTFKANGGAGTDVTMNFDCGQKYNLIQNPFTRAGFEFNGWNTAADGSGTGYEERASVTDLVDAGENIIFYAQWKGAPATVKYLGISIEFNGSITIMQKLTVSEDLYNDKEAYILYDNGSRIDFGSLTFTGDENERIVWIRCDFSVKEVYDTRTAKIYTSDGKECTLLNDTNKQLANNTLSTTAYTYLQTIVKNQWNSYSERNVATAQGLLDFGTCADAYFNGAETSEISALNDVDESSFTKYIKVNSGSADGLTYAGASLHLENKTFIRHYFMLDEGHNINDYTIKRIENSYTYNTVFTESAVPGLYYIDVMILTYTNFDATYTLKMTKGGDFSLTYGMYAYAYDALTITDNEKLHNLVKSMYLFGKSSEL